MSGRRRGRGSNIAMLGTVIVAAVATYHLGLLVGFLVGAIGATLAAVLTYFEERAEERAQRRARMRAAAWRDEER